jgi:transcriptional regulator with XRE-family HTH domain
VDKDKGRGVCRNWKLRNDALLTVGLWKADNETRKGGKAMLNLKNIGQNLKELRVQSHLSQDDVADKLYVSRQAISNWESGKSLPTIDNCILLLCLYHTDIDSLLLLNNPRNQETDLDGNNRQAVITSIINGRQKIDLSKVFYQFSKEERLRILKAVKDKRLAIEPNKLIPYLSDEERSYLGLKVSLTYSYDN